MTLTILCRSACVLTLLSTTLSAQVSDPFGGNSKTDDPFAESKSTKDPFGGKASGSNPFGGDPFGRPTAATDPFASTPAAKDPFGGPSKTRKAAATKKPPAAAAASSLRRDNPAEWIRQKLDERTTMSAVQTPLAEVVQQLSQMHELSMVIDSRGLEEIGLSPDVPMSLSLKDVTLRAYLRLALHEYDLAYSIQNEVLIITSAEAAERFLSLRSYSLPESLNARSPEVVKALTTTVSPDSWEMGGGTCSLAVVENVLMVRATERVHEGVDDFLKKLAVAVNAR